MFASSGTMLPMMTQEEWRDIKGFPGWEVSSLGAVRGPGRWGRPSLLRPQQNGRGYLKVSLGRSNVRYIHRLVAEAFLPIPEGEAHVNHIDGNKANNVLSNLEWVDRVGNAQHASAM